MDAEKLFASLERFFLDVVGLMVPGALLLIGFKVLYASSGSMDWLSGAESNGALIAAASYVAGHAVATIGALAIAPMCARIAIPIVALLRMAKGKSAKWDPVIVTRSQLEQRVATRTTTIALGKRFDTPSPSSSDVHRLRNIAMTSMKSEDKATVVRLMSLAMLNLGVASVAVLLGVYGLMGGAFASMPTTQGAPWDWVHLATGAKALLVLSALSLPFLHRYFEFYDRTIRLPFDIAAAVPPESKSALSPAPDSLPSISPGSRGPMRVYMAGGHHSAWRETLMKAAPSFRFHNPVGHGLADPAAYTAWDLEAVRRCDVVFAYLEASNPSGIGLSVEVGFGVAMGKHVILVDEKTASGGDTARHMAFLRHAATVCFDTMDGGTAYLSKLGVLGIA